MKSTHGVGQRLSVLDLADIYRLITRDQLTAEQVGERCGRYAKAMRPVLKYFVQAGVADVCAWDMTVRGTRTAIFAAGTGKVAPLPMTRAGAVPATGWGKGHRTKPRLNCMVFCGVVRAIMTDGATVDEIVEHVGCHWDTANNIVNHMREISLCYIGAWVSNRNCGPSRVFKLGRGKTAPRPAPMSNAVRCKRDYWARKARSQQAAFQAAFFGHPMAEAA